MVTSLMATFSGPRVTCISVYTIFFYKRKNKILKVLGMTSLYRITAVAFFCQRHSLQRRSSQQDKTKVWQHSTKQMEHKCSNVGGDKMFVDRHKSVVSRWLCRITTPGLCKCCGVKLEPRSVWREKPGQCLQYKYLRTAPSAEARISLRHLESEPKLI